MSDDGHKIIYEPDEPDDDDRIEDAKKRGLGRSFFNVAEHDSVQEGFAAIEKYNNPIRTRYRGRTINQSRTRYNNQSRPVVHVLLVLHISIVWLQEGIQDINKQV